MISRCPIRPGAGGLPAGGVAPCVPQPDGECGRSRRPANGAGRGRRWTRARRHRGRRARIPESDLERVFEPFVWLDASQSRDTGGAGPGLAIARTIIRGHGGDIRLENCAEGGLRATVVLPEGGGG